MSKSFVTLNRKNTDSIKWNLAEKACENRDCYLFSIADSDYETAPIVKEVMIERVNHGAFGYVNKGDDFETLIKTWYKERFMVDISEDMIISTPSVLNSIAVSLQNLTKEDEGVIIQTPVYHMFKEVIDHNHRLVIDNPLSLEDLNYSMNLSHLETLFQAGHKSIIICNPHNPIGRVWTQEELSQLVELAKIYDVLIISDEIHADIIMPNHHFYSMAHFFNDYKRIIVISAPTKVFNIAGLQIAQVIIKDKEIREKISDAYLRLHLIRPNLMALTALKAAYKEGHQWVEAQNKHIYENYIYLDAFLKDEKWLKLYPLEGTYLAWIEINLPNGSIEEFIEELKHYGVFVSPGQGFQNARNYIRFSLACSKEQLEKGLVLFKKCLNS